MGSVVEIFTIGHSNVVADRIIDLLQQNEIALVVDVRSVPHSRFAHQFNKRLFAHTLDTASIGYTYARQALGGRPDDPACYENGELIYALVQRQPWYQEGIDRLLELAQVQRCAIMCSEEDPDRCHRQHLVAQTLLDRGVAVWHIRHDGSLRQAHLDTPPVEQLKLL